jgi:hypothetical protein
MIHSLRKVFESSARKANRRKASIRDTKLMRSSDKCSCWNKKYEAILITCKSESMHLITLSNDATFKDDEAACAEVALSCKGVRFETCSGLTYVLRLF